MSHPERPMNAVKLLGEIAKCIFAYDTVEAIAQDVFARLREYLDLDLFISYLVTDDHEHLRLAASAGLTQEQAKAIATLRFNEGVCGTVAARQEGIVLHHVQASDDPITSFVRDLGARAYICHPLRSRLQPGTPHVGHASARRGTFARTCSRAYGSTGLTRWRAKPASRARCLSASCPKPVIAIRYGSPSVASVRTARARS